MSVNGLRWVWSAIGVALCFVAVMLSSRGAANALRAMLAIAKIVTKIGRLVGFIGARLSACGRGIACALLAIVFVTAGAASGQAQVMTPDPTKAWFRLAAVSDTDQDETFRFTVTGPAPSTETIFTDDIITTDSNISVTSNENHDIPPGDVTVRVEVPTGFRFDGVECDNTPDTQTSTRILDTTGQAAPANPFTLRGLRARDELTCRAYFSRPKVWIHLIKKLKLGVPDGEFTFASSGTADGGPFTVTTTDGLSPPSEAFGATLGTAMFTETSVAATELHSVSCVGVGGSLHGESIEASVTNKRDGVFSVKVASTQSGITCTVTNALAPLPPPTLVKEISKISKTQARNGIFTVDVTGAGDVEPLKLDTGTTFISER